MSDTRREFVYSPFWISYTNQSLVITDIVQAKLWNGAIRPSTIADILLVGVKNSCQYVPGAGLPLWMIPDVGSGLIFDLFPMPPPPPHTHTCMDTLYNVNYLLSIASCKHRVWSQNACHTIAGFNKGAITCKDDAMRPPTPSNVINPRSCRVI